MQRQAQWFIVYPIVCLLTVALEAQQPFVHGSDVAFTIKTNRTQHKVGESIVISYTIRNVSNGALFVPRSQWNMRCGDPPHLWVRLEDSSGKHYEPGYGGSCLGRSPQDEMSLSERMQRDAVLLKPGQLMHGAFTFEPNVFPDLKLGSYRLEAVLYGWNVPFSAPELSELHTMGAPFLIGEIHATTHVELLAAAGN